MWYPNKTWKHDLVSMDIRDLDSMTAASPGVILLSSTEQNLLGNLSENQSSGNFK